MIVYRHIRLDKNQVFYVGIGENEKRAYDKKHRSKFWKNIVSNADYEVEILFENLSLEEAIKKEIEFIALYGRQDLKRGTLVNLTDGGEGTFGYKHTKETKEKLSICTHNQMLGTKRPDHSKKIKGENNPCFGRVGEKHPMFGKTGYWKGKIRQDRAKSIEYQGETYRTYTELAKKLGRSKSYITKLTKKNN